jgi:hypothetical protein
MDFADILYVVGRNCMLLLSLGVFKRRHGPLYYSVRDFSPIVNFNGIIGDLYESDSEPKKVL